MPRNMSFSMTTGPFRARTKTVTRRFGWWFLKPGDVVCGVVQSRGLKKGERVVRLGLIRIVSTRAEPLNAITAAELVLEGLPDTSPRAFVDRLCARCRVPPHEPANRIEFEYLD
ncbi:MAG: ASCH domain-containing protein [Proteobacteria bacterium]|nr:ASCH domain-containing protein [Pseudomonadota bacterium]